MANYVLDDNNNRKEAYSKEELLAVLAQAINDGSLNNIVADAAFISKLKCCVGGTTFNQAFITQAKYNELAANNQLMPNTKYEIIDDTTADDIDEHLEQLDRILNGTLEVPVATTAKNVDAKKINLESGYSKIDGLPLWAFFEVDDEQKLTQNVWAATRLAPKINTITMDVTSTPTVNLVLDWGATYVFQVKQATFILTIPSKEIATAGGATGVTYFSTIGATTEGTAPIEVLLKYVKNVDGSTNKITLLNKSGSDWVNYSTSNANKTITISYYKAA